MHRAALLPLMLLGFVVLAIVYLIPRAIYRGIRYMFNRQPAVRTVKHTRRTSKQVHERIATYV
jgi:hypothetical protein